MLQWALSLQRIVVRFLGRHHASAKVFPSLRASITTGLGQVQGQRQSQLAAWHCSQRTACRVRLILFCSVQCLNQLDTLLSQQQCPLPGTYARAPTTELIRRFPDGLTLGSDGNFWVTILTPPLPALQAVMPYRAGRWLAAWLLQVYRPNIPSFAMVVQASRQSSRGPAACSLCKAICGVVCMFQSGLHLCKARDLRSCAPDGSL